MNHVCVTTAILLFRPDYVPLIHLWSLGCCSKELENDIMSLVSLTRENQVSKSVILTLHRCMYDSLLLTDRLQLTSLVYITMSWRYFRHTDVQVAWPKRKPTVGLPPHSIRHLVGSYNVPIQALTSDNFHGPLYPPSLDPPFIIQRDLRIILML